MSTARPRSQSAVALLADVPSTGQLGDTQAQRFTMAGGTVAERAEEFVGFAQQRLDAGHKVIALYPAWQADPAERALRFARGSRRSDHIAGIKLNLSPLTLSLLADQLAYLAPYVPAGVVAALAERLPTQMLGGAWLRTVTNLGTLPTTVRQHVQSYKPKAGFLATCAPQELVQQTKGMPSPPRPQDPVQILVAPSEKGDRSWFDGSFSMEMRAAGVHTLPDQPLARTYWGTPKYVEFVAFSAHPQALTNVVNSLKPSLCRWCAEPVCALACPFCGEANPNAMSMTPDSELAERPDHVPAAPAPPSEEERRRYQEEQERRRREEQEREQRRQERIEARLRRKQAEEEERERREREAAERKKREEEEVLRTYREQQKREEEARKRREEEERRRKEKEEARKLRKAAPVVHVHAGSGAPSTGGATPPAAGGPQPGVAGAQSGAGAAAGHGAGVQEPGTAGPRPVATPMPTPPVPTGNAPADPGDADDGTAPAVPPAAYGAPPAPPAQRPAAAAPPTAAAPQPPGPAAPMAAAAPSAASVRPGAGPGPGAGSPPTAGTDSPSPEGSTSEGTQQPTSPASPSVQHHHTYEGPEEVHQHNYYSIAPPGPAESWDSGWPSSPIRRSGSEPPWLEDDSEEDARTTSTNLRRPGPVPTTPTGGDANPNTTASAQFSKLAQASWSLRVRTAPYRGWQPPVEHERPPVSPDRRIATGKQKSLKDTRGAAPDRSGRSDGPNPPPEGTGAPGSGGRPPGDPPRRPDGPSTDQRRTDPAHRPSPPGPSPDRGHGPAPEASADPPFYAASKDRIATRVSNHRRGTDTATSPPSHEPPRARHTTTSTEEPSLSTDATTSRPDRWWEEDSVVEDEVPPEEETWPELRHPQPARSETPGRDTHTSNGDASSREPATEPSRERGVTERDQPRSSVPPHGGVTSGSPAPADLLDPSTTEPVYEYRNGTV